MTDRSTLSLRGKMIGALLREARLRSGKSLTESASLINISPSTLSSYEHARKAISLPELEILSYHFNRPLSFFLQSSVDDLRTRPVFDASTVLTLRHRMIGAKLRAQRLAKQHSIKGVGQATGFPASRISAYEHGARPVPLPELEILTVTLGQELDDYVETQGPVAERLAALEAYENIRKLPMDLLLFLATPENMEYVTIAKQLSELGDGEVRQIADTLLKLTRS